MAQKRGTGVTAKKRREERSQGARERASDLDKQRGGEKEAVPKKRKVREKCIEEIDWKAERGTPASFFVPRLGISHQQQKGPSRRLILSWSPVLSPPQFFFWLCGGAAL